jgi:hypothetical protein
MEVGLPGQILLEEMLGEPLPPHQGQAVLKKLVEDRHQRGSHKDSHVIQAKGIKRIHFSIGERCHEPPTDKTVDDIQAAEQ